MMNAHNHILLCSYNKTEKDFSTLREYNDYLEEVETISESVIKQHGDQ